jgi:hypothetical protein
VKQQKPELSPIQIQNLLAQNYHLIKWQLVEVTEVEARETHLQKLQLEAKWLL